MNCCPRVVFIDLDGVIWDHDDISQTTPPYKCFDNKLIDSNDVIVEIHSGVREFLDFARRRNLYLYVLSWNNPFKAVAALDCLSLLKYFNGYSIREDPLKYIGMKEILSKLGVDVNPCQVIYIDDRDIHVEDIYRYVGDVVFIHMWRSIRSFPELINYISELLNTQCRESI